MNLEDLVRVSNRYGADKDYVLAGGGNTSLKDDAAMFVKASGTELASIQGEGFVKMDLAKLDAIWSNSYPADEDEREARVLEDLMAARFPSQEGKRPSVESLLHALIPYAWVVHTHPALVNGISCSRNGEAAVRELFGSRALWIPVINPGYILAKEVHDRAKEYTEQGKEFPKLIFLQNHGVFVSADSEKDIDALYAEMIEKFSERVETEPAGESNDLEKSLTAELGDLLKSISDEELSINGFVNRDILEMAAGKEAFEPLSLSFTPDHIVYYGYKPVYAESLETIPAAVRQFREEEGMMPRLLVVKDLGAFSVNDTPTKALKGRLLFEDDVRIAVYTRSFGGHQFMPQDKIDFIRNWEVEQYRSSLSK